MPCYCMWKKEYSKAQQPPPSSLPESSPVEKYQNRLLKLEQKERKYIKHILQHRLIKESLEMRIAEYIQMEEDFEEMKLKFRYEEGKFLSNDRKDNEIIILRSENSNLKTEITTLEQNIKKLQNEITECKQKLSNLTKMNNELKQLLEEKQKELNYTMSIFELVKLDHEVKNGQIKVKEVSGMRKDRYSSIAYNYWCMCQLELKLKPKQQNTNLVSQLSIRPARRFSSF